MKKELLEKFEKDPLGKFLGYVNREFRVVPVGKKNRYRFSKGSTLSSHDHLSLLRSSIKSTKDDPIMHCLSQNESGVKFILSETEFDELVENGSIGLINKEEVKVLNFFD